MTRRVLALLVVLVAATAARTADDGPAPAAPPVTKKAPHVTQAPFGCVWEDLAAARAASEKDGHPVVLYFTFDG